MHGWRVLISHLNMISWNIAQRIDKTRLHKNTFSTEWPPLFRAEGGQVEPVLGGGYQALGGGQCAIAAHSGGDGLGTGGHVGLEGVLESAR